MSWSSVNSTAYYDGATPSITLFQENILEAQKYYFIEINVNVVKGKLQINGFSDNISIDVTGNYTFYSKSIGVNLSLVPSIYLGNMFNGSIEIVSLYELPTYEIREKGTDTLVYEFDGTNAVATNGYAVCEIDWSLLDGCYYLKLNASGVDYYTPTLKVTDNIDCTLLFSWTNNDNAFGFEFIDTLFNPIWRGVAKVWKSNYEADKNEYYTDSKGTRIALYVRSVKKKLLTINEVPEYIHDALRLAVKSDNFFVDGIQYVVEDGDYQPTWRNSSENAPVELEIIPYTQNTINTNCK
jgi:hypothetical protein